MVRLVQLVEHQIVVLGVVGSSPTSHPSKKAVILLVAVTELVEVTAFFVIRRLLSPAEHRFQRR